MMKKGVIACSAVKQSQLDLAAMSMCLKEPPAGDQGQPLAYSYPSQDPDQVLKFWIWIC